MDLVPTPRPDAPPLAGRGDGANGWDGRSFAHEGFFFDGADQLVDRCGPFIEEGLDADQPVLVIASDPVRSTLEQALGPATIRSLTSFDPAESWWRGAHPTMAAYVAALEPLRQQGTPWRLVAEPIWLASPEGRYWSRFEAVANITLADYPYYSLCLHDHGRLDDDTVRHARCTHPRVVDATDRSARSAWRGATPYLEAVEPSPEPRSDGARTVGHTALQSVRAHVRSVATAVGLARERLGDVVLAVDELAANALTHVEQVELTCWVHDVHLVVEVRDDGPGFHNPLAGYDFPPTQGRRGRGLWIARALSDDLTIRSSGHGTCIQAFFRL